jgi:hypothetical protein
VIARKSAERDRKDSRAIADIASGSRPHKSIMDLIEIPVAELPYRVAIFRVDWTMLVYADIQDSSAARDERLSN